MTCEGTEKDRYRRLIATCTADDLDMGAQLVTEGWTLAYCRYSTDYVDEEAAARKSGAGMWSMQFQTPWDWHRNPRFSFH